MKRMLHHIASLAAMLLTAWSFAGCERTDVIENSPELSVSIYIPDMGATKGETGSVGALDDEKVISSLQLWVFIHGGTDDGQLVGYKAFTGAQLTDTGIPHSTITRFGMPLSPGMFNTLSADGARVDVYVVANAESATDISLGEGTERKDLDGIVLSGSTFGVDPLIMTVPGKGLPMSGMLKAASVTGDYPVLTISTVTLTRAVSKIRFVFCQQGKPSSGSESIVPSNSSCVIKSITFGGTSEGHDCQIAKSEKLFTDQKYAGTDNLFDIEDYTPLSTVIPESGNGPLMSNADITVCERPEELLFQSDGHKSESAREYEARLTAAVAESSQYGPIYIRETDKLISGTVLYDIGEGDVEATFSMPSGNLLTRNHSWLLYAYFSETTRTLQFQIVVCPWDKETYNYGFETQTVNVIRRFTIQEDPTKFYKHQNENGYFDIYFWHTLNNEPNVIKGDILIDSPIGQKIHVVPVYGAPEGRDPLEGIFSITPMVAVIYKDGTASEHCKVEYEIRCNPGTHSSAELEGNYMDLHFCVEIGDNEKWIDLDSESIDYYRIILKEEWEPSEENEE